MRSLKLLSLFGFFNIPKDLAFTSDTIERIVSSPRSEDSTEFLLMLFEKLKEKDANTAFHSVEVAYLSLWMARKTLPSSQWFDVFLGGLLHDIGKLSFNFRLFNGERNLSLNELDLIKNHTIYGFEQIKDLTDSKIIKDMVLCHHESNDGTGYPFQLRGKEISIYAKIARISDVLSALTSPRYYRDEISIPVKEALTIMNQQASCFDPTLFQEVNLVITKETLTTTKY